MDWLTIMIIAIFCIGYGVSGWSMYDFYANYYKGLKYDASR
jgi:hypothetical protein